MIYEIDPSAKKIIDWYANLNIGNKKVTCPYYRNIPHVRAELRSLVGKGTPDEIETETVIFSKLRGFSLTKHSIPEIREFMRSQGIGIDCSGFVSHIYDSWLRHKKNRPLQNFIKFDTKNLYQKFTRFLRPIEHTNVFTLTSPANSQKIDYQDSMPGDMIKMHGLKHGLHIALIYKIQKEEDNKLRKIYYVESSPYYREANGIRFGEIDITSNSKELEQQDWDLNLAGASSGQKFTLQAYLKEIEDNGIFRPNFISKLLPKKNG